MLKEITFPTSLLLWPAINVEKSEAVETSNKYLVAPVELSQVAVKEVGVILLAAVAVGDEISSNEIVFELELVSVTFEALTL